MALFKWPGGSVDTLPRPSVPSVKAHKEKMEAQRVARRASSLDEYSELAAAAGLSVPDANIEAFKDFLVVKDWSVFSLANVISYMDRKAADESKDKCGWEWRPLREKDHVLNAEWGREARREWHINNVPKTIQAASDYYSGPAERIENERVWVDLPMAQGAPIPHSNMTSTVMGVTSGYLKETGNKIRQLSAARVKTYDKTIPIHALKKVVAVEKEFTKAPVHFFVCDYAVAPQVEYPDPFLMAVIPCDNDSQARGVGRFIIDFWDEPGFGLEQQLA